MRYIVKKTPLSQCYQEESGISFFYEGCDLVGYMPMGDSFVFSQGQRFTEGKDKRVLFCLSRNFLERVLKDYPTQEDYPTLAHPISPIQPTKKK